MIPEGIINKLGSAEQPLAFEMAQQFAHADAIGREAPTVRNSTTWDSSGFLDPTGGPLDVDVNWFSSRLSGLAAGGADGSLGDKFRIALGVPASDHLLLTTHRLAIVGGQSRGLSLDVTHDIYFSVDRRAVVNIQRAPRLMQRGRVRIDFADGSWAMAMMGMFLTRAANRFIAAFGPPRA